jgi:hypothetical protein
MIELYIQQYVELFIKIPSDIKSEPSESQINIPKGKTIVNLKPYSIFK